MNRPAHSEAEQPRAAVRSEGEDRFEVRLRQVKPIFTFLLDAPSVLRMIARNLEKGLAPKPHDFMIAGTVPFVCGVFARERPVGLGSKEVAEVLICV